jgi:hypothetical protein
VTVQQLLVIALLMLTVFRSLMGGITSVLTLIIRVGDAIVVITIAVKSARKSIIATQTYLSVKNTLKQTNQARKSSISLS